MPDCVDTPARRKSFCTVTDVPTTGEPDEIESVAPLIDGAGSPITATDAVYDVAFVASTTAAASHDP